MMYLFISIVDDLSDIMVQSLRLGGPFGFKGRLLGGRAFATQPGPFRSRLCPQSCLQVPTEESEQLLPLFAEKLRV